MTLYLGPPAALAVAVAVAGGSCLGLSVGLLALALYSRLIDPLIKGANRRSLGALAGLLPFPLPLGTFPVVVTIRHGNSVTGLDEAMAAFVDGWLVVEGGRTSFSLRAVDGKPQIMQGTLRIALPEFQTVTLDLVRDRGLDVRASGFAYAATHWAEWHGVLEGEPILPPLATLPLLYRGWNALGIGGFLLVIAIEGVRYWTGFGPFSLLATALAYLGGLAFCRTLFMTRGQEEADRRAKALAETPSELECGRLVRDDALR